MRYLALFLILILLAGCNSPRREHAEEERAIHEELRATEQQQQEQQQQHRDPDGAFGAKDYASEAREQSDRNTKALQEAAEAEQ